MATAEHRILITGSSGFVGQWLQRHLMALPATLVFTLDHDRTASGDIRDAALVSEAIRSSSPTAVVHLAAVTATGEAAMAPSTAWDVNLVGTLNLARAVLEHAPKARFIFASSSEAYGAAFNETQLPVHESTPLRPLTTYGATKAATELALGQMARAGLDLAVFRPFNHTGPGQTSRFAVPSFARQISLIERGRAEPILYVGNTAVQRDFLDVRDVVRAYADCARGRMLPSGAIMNLSTGHPVSIDRLLSILLDLAEMPIEVRVDPQRMRESDVPVASGDPTSARTLMDWRPEIDIEDTTRDVLAWWRTQV